MTRVMVVGDIHGNTNEALSIVDAAEERGIDTIFQCGDFGIWPGKGGIDFLDTLNADLLTRNIYMIFLDGNHEDHDALDWYREHNPRTIWGQIFIRSNILYSPRGCQFEFGGKRFMTVGGAVSIDKSIRTKGESWWPQEQLTDDELDTILAKHERDGYDVDYLLTHDCPTNAPFRERLKNDLDSQVHRQRMDRLGKAVQPKIWLHGHMHTQYDGYEFPTYEPTTTVYGLECDAMQWNSGILDTENDSFEWIDGFEGVEWYDLPMPEYAEVLPD